MLTKWQKNWKNIEGRLRRIFNMFYLPEDITICECDPATILASGHIVSLKAATIFLDARNSMSFPVDYTWRYCDGRLNQGFSK